MKIKNLNTGHSKTSSLQRRQDTRRLRGNGFATGVVHRLCLITNNFFLVFLSFFLLSVSLLVEDTDKSFRNVDNQKNKDLDFEKFHRSTESVIVSSLDYRNTIDKYWNKTRV